MKMEKNKRKKIEAYNTYGEIIYELNELRLSLLKSEFDIEKTKERVAKLISNWNLEGKGDLDIPEEEKAEETKDLKLKWIRVITCKSNDLTIGLYKKI